MFPGVLELRVFCPHSFFATIPHVAHIAIFRSISSQLDAMTFLIIRALLELCSREIKSPTCTSSEA
jgi:hypothetical protein